MSRYRQQGRVYRLENSSETPCDGLPLGTYGVGFSPLGGFYLEEIPDISVPTKVYGDSIARAERVLATFQDRARNTGVLLSGLKGTGKTMLAACISRTAREQGISTLVISTAYTGDDFNRFLADVGEPCVIIIDEFEKLYDPKTQPELLSLFDGAVSGRKLFVLTANNKFTINVNFLNMPGRILYALDFTGIEEPFIREYCGDHGISPEHADSVVQISKLLENFSFDQLAALVAEMNRWGESPHTALQWLNISIESVNANYNVELYRDGEPVAPTDITYNRTWYGKPTDERITIEYIDRNDLDSDGEPYTHSVQINPGDIYRYDIGRNGYRYRIEENGHQYEVVLVRKVETQFGLSNLSDVF